MSTVTCTQEDGLESAITDAQKTWLETHQYHPAIKSKALYTNLKEVSINILYLDELLALEVPKATTYSQYISNTLLAYGLKRFKDPLNRLRAYQDGWQKVNSPFTCNIDSLQRTLLELKEYVDALDQNALTNRQKRDVPTDEPAKLRVNMVGMALVSNQTTSVAAFQIVADAIRDWYCRRDFKNLLCFLRELKQSVTISESYEQFFNTDGTFYGAKALQYLQWLFHYRFHVDIYRGSLKRKCTTQLKQDLKLPASKYLVVEPNSYQQIGPLTFNNSYFSLPRPACAEPPDISDPPEGAPLLPNVEEQPPDPEPEDTGELEDPDDTMDDDQPPQPGTGNLDTQNKRSRTDSHHNEDVNNSSVGHNTTDQVNDNANTLNTDNIGGLNTTTTNRTLILPDSSLTDDLNNEGTLEGDDENESNTTQNQHVKVEPQEQNNITLGTPSVSQNGQGSSSQQDQVDMDTSDDARDEVHIRTGRNVAENITFGEKLIIDVNDLFLRLHKHYNENNINMNIMEEKGKKIKNTGEALLTAFETLSFNPAGLLHFNPFYNCEVLQGNKVAYLNHTLMIPTQIHLNHIIFKPTPICSTYCLELQKHKYDFASPDFPPTSYCNIIYTSNNPSIIFCKEYTTIPPPCLKDKGTNPKCMYDIKNRADYMLLNMQAIYKCPPNEPCSYRTLGGGLLAAGFGTSQEDIANKRFYTFMGGTLAYFYDLNIDRETLIALCLAALACIVEVVHLTVKLILQCSQNLSTRADRKLKKNKGYNKRSRTYVRAVNADPKVIPLLERLPPA